MTLGSLFDGIGGFPLCAVQSGIEPVWAAEIDPQCVGVTHRHFRGMEHLGSVTEIDGGDIPPVDIITFGSPCQDLSVAGKRAGLAGERSGLFAEAVRIIKEMREKTHGRYPTIAVWENVPGAFSSNGGEDFRQVLQQLAGAAGCDTAIPIPTGKWRTAGAIVGGGWSIAWRVLNAQFWGVPQRRRRIYLVADFGGERATEILFEQKGMRGNTAPREQEREKASAHTGGGAEGCSGGEINGISAGFIGGASASAGSVGFECEKSPTLRAGLKMSCIQAEKEPSAANQVTCPCYPDIAPTLTTRSGDSSPMAGQMQNIVSVLDCRGNGDGTDMLIAEKDCADPSDVRYIVRRLTPMECERLQGFPDGWTKWMAGGTVLKDSPRYRMLGNSLAIPTAYHVISRVAKALEGERL